jgi:GTPase SAR1 family protein
MLAGRSMLYTPLVQTFPEQRNQFCRAYEIDELLHLCHRTEILPGGEDYSQFSADEVLGGLYISERIWVDGVDPPDTKYPHETHLDRLFWDTKLTGHPICLLGAVGAGKTTLIKYYLRCHCPALGANRSEFDKKLILYFDAKQIQDNVDFYHDFFLMMQAVIRLRCARKGFDIDLAIKRRPTRTQNIREWFRAALEELTRVSDRAGSEQDQPFQYIVLVVDNLDQTTIEVQIRAITEIEQWLRTPTIRLWRVILPMWESTFNKLRNHQFSQLNDAKKFVIGTISADRLISTRAHATQTQLQRLSSSAAKAAIEYITEISALARERLNSRIQALAHGNIRHMLSLWEGLLCSDAAYGIWRQYPQTSRDSRRTFDYELLDALIVGKRDALDHSEHRVANLFAMGHARVRPRDLLIGPHALHLFAQNRQTREDISQALISIGYSSTNINEVEKSMMIFNFFHQVPNREGKIEYEIHLDTVNEYMSLQFEPAYIDNISMVTSVTKKHLKNMHKTRGDRPDDFCRRVETSLAFLEFLRECEDQFRSVALLRWSTPEVFVSALEDLKIPCLWRRMALRYLDRLVGLRKSGYLKSIDASWWDAKLSCAIFDEAEKEETYLTSRP